MRAFQTTNQDNPHAMHPLTDALPCLGGGNEGRYLPSYHETWAFMGLRQPALEGGGVPSHVPLPRLRGRPSKQEGKGDRPPTPMATATHVRPFWLILPVVICLSQRLSHACLSTSLYTVKLRMAH